jgi:DNA-binding transcriptional regulator YiaG
MDDIVQILSEYPEWLQRSEMAYTLGVTDQTVKRWGEGRESSAAQERA